jgi:ribosomal protein L37AE/L43A
MWGGWTLRAVRWKEVGERLRDYHTCEYDGERGVELRADGVWDVVECWVCGGESLFEEV